MNENKYKLPWKVIYEEEWNYNEKGEWGPWGGLRAPLCVMCIENCDGITVVETDSGVYSPSPEEAELIVKCVNNSGE